MIDFTKELSEAQQAALFTLLTYAEPAERGIDWDDGNPVEFDDIELARRCLLEAWPVDDWNRRIDSDDESERCAALLDSFDPSVGTSEFAGLRTTGPRKPTTTKGD